MSDFRANSAGPVWAEGPSRQAPYAEASRAALAGQTVGAALNRPQATMETAFDAVFQKLEGVADLVARRTMAVSEVTQRLRVSADRLVGTRPEDPRDGAEGEKPYPAPDGALSALHAKIDLLNRLVADMPLPELAAQAARFEGLA